MGRQKNDGRGRLSDGRKGSPNKIPAAIRSAIARALDLYFNTEELKAHPEDEVAVNFLNDLKNLNPVQRASLIEKFVSYVAPKLQTTTLEMAAESRKTIEDRLIELSEDAKD